MSSSEAERFTITFAPAMACRIEGGAGTHAAQFARDCRAKQVRIVHHDPFHSDATLDAASAEIGVPFAREGEVILL